MIFFFLTDELEEPEFQKAHECGNTSHTYNFCIKLRFLIFLVSLAAILLLMSLHMLIFFSHCLLPEILL